MLNVNLGWNKLCRSVSKIGKFLLLVVLGSSAAILLSLIPAIAQPSPQPQLPMEESTEAEVIPEVGWEFLGSRDLNQAAIDEIEYEGDCPGTEETDIEARFTSSEVPPAPRRRVIVRNITRGVASDPYPYTDREYEEGRSSDPTRMEFGTEHSNRRLHVLEGENEFEYEILERGRMIDSGRFTALIEKIVDVQRRDATARTDRVCMNSAVGLNLCADVRTRTQHTCPGGRVLRTELEPNTPDITTLISNQTPVTVEY